jgi:hypothetical protein
MAILHYKNNLPAGEAIVVTHDVANATYIVAGNNTVSNVGSAGATVERAAVTRIWYGAQSAAHWVVSRGANTIAVLIGTGELSFEGAGVAKDPTANLVVTLHGGTVGYVMTEMKLKQRAGE